MKMPAGMRTAYDDRMRIVRAYPLRLFFQLI